MEPIDAIRQRHSVRNYTDRPIEKEKAGVLLAAVGRINAETGLNIQLVMNEPRAFSSGIWRYGWFSGVRNYFVMAAPKGKEVEEKVGYYGEMLVILAQTLGLNTCWVGLSYRKIPGTFTLRGGDVVHCVISVGYGETPGVPHTIRPAEDYYRSVGRPPGWFLNGMRAVMLAPTAINQQKFRFILHPGGKVEARALFSLAGYTRVDLGIAKYHFEIGAGSENFEWK